MTTTSSLSPPRTPEQTAIFVRRASILDLHHDPDELEVGQVTFHDEDDVVVVEKIATVLSAISPPPKVKTPHLEDEEASPLLAKAITPIPLPADPRLEFMGNVSPVPDGTDSYAVVKKAVFATAAIVAAVYAYVVLVGKPRA